MKNSKTYDCVAAKHAAAESLHKKLKGKSIKARLVFWQAHERSMRDASQGNYKKPAMEAK